MGKLIRNGIEYGGGNGTDIFEVTQAEYDALVQAGTLVHNALYVITDAPNLNETSKQISYDGGTDTVWDKVESKPNIIVSDNITIGTVTAGTKYDLYTLSNFTGGKITQFSQLKGLMFLGGGGNALSYGYLFCSPANNIISYIPQVSDTGVAIKIAVLY